MGLIARPAGNGAWRATMAPGLAARDDAVLLSCGANAAHGFRRSNRDKRKAVRQATLSHCATKRGQLSSRLPSSMTMIS